jgi:Flp pilus assembly CpaE family ATPase
MTSLTVAVVSRDQVVRLAAARAFDGAPASWHVELHDDPPAQADVVVVGPDYKGDANGALSFDPDRPDRVVEDIKRAVRSLRGRVVLVAGAGRGVGVTTVALHLARAAAQNSSSVCFVDLDLEWGACDRLGLDDDALSWAHVDRAGDSLRLAALPVEAGFRALLAPRTLLSPRTEPHVDPALLLDQASAEFENLVVDCAAAPVQPDVLRHASAAVLVVSPTVPGVRRARRLLASIERAGGGPRWAIVFNRLGPGGETTRHALQRMLQHRVAVELPCVASLRDAEDRGRLIGNRWTRFTSGVARLHTALQNELRSSSRSNTGIGGGDPSVTHGLLPEATVGRS